MATFVSNGCCTLLPTALLWLCLTEPARSVEYAVDGWKLGSTVTGASLQSTGASRYSSIRLPSAHARRA
jgi:hypothetical protein